MVDKLKITRYESNLDLFYVIGFQFVVRFERIVDWLHHSRFDIGMLQSKYVAEFVNSHLEQIYLWCAHLKKVLKNTARIKMLLNEKNVFKYKFTADGIDSPGFVVVKMSLPRRGEGGVCQNGTRAVKRCVLVGMTTGLKTK